MSSLVVSALPGRLRLRHRSLRDPDASAEAASSLRSTAGVVQTDANPQTGSLLIRYQPDEVTVAELLDRVAIEGAGPSGQRRFSRQPLELGIAGTLATSVVAAMTGMKTLHIASGAVFLGLASLHILRVERRRYRNEKERVAGSTEPADAPGGNES